MGKGLGQAQMRILGLLLKAGGVLTVPALLVGLFGRISPGAEEYNRAHSTLSRTLAALRVRHLIQTYQGVAVGGRGMLIASLTAQGVKEARKIVWKGP